MNAFVVVALACLIPAEPEPFVDNAPAKLGALRAEMLGDGAPNYSQVVDYGLEAKLDPEQKKVRGRGRVIWKNTGSQPITALWWHLYLNAFKNESSTFIRESGGKLRGDERKAGEWGWIEVTEMSARLLATTPTTSSNYADIMPGRSFEHPDDNNADDETVLRTPLPFEIVPGAQVEVRFEFTSKLPPVFARSGYAHEFFMVSQWFPKLGVLQETFKSPAPDQEVILDSYAEPAWNCHQYHAHSEFFADYGVFRAVLQVPAGYVVAATGRRVSAQENVDGMSTYEYVQERVHDFAWTADRRFVELTRRFGDSEVTDQERKEAADLLRLDPSDLVLGDVQVRVLLQPEHVQYADRYFASIFAGLKWFGLWYGAYPYDVLTLVDGPRGSGGAMGMEYPTLITGGVSWPAPERVPRPETVTVHEFGHQYWYGLVGTNEFEESWLDEGFNTYSTGKVVDRAFGPFVLAPKVLSIPLVPWFSDVEYTQAMVFRMGNMLSPDQDAVVTESWRYKNSLSYSVNSYPRPAAVLHQLEHQIGPEAMARVMRTYHLRYRYRHPSTEDFIAVVQEVSGRDMGDFMSRTLHTAGKVDYGIAELTSERRSIPAGVFSKPGEGPLVHTEVSVQEAELQSEEGSGVYDSEVLVVRHGSVPFAHTMQVYFTDGSTQSAVWDGRHRWKRFKFESETKAVSAELYAARPMVLDTSPTNDTRRMKGSARPGVTWGAHLLYLTQTLLDVLGGLL